MDSTQSKEEKRLKDKVGSIQKRGGVVDISHLLLPSDDAYVDHFHNQLVPIGEIDINCGVNGHEEDDSDMFDVCLYPVTDCKKSVSVKRERTNLHNAGKVKPADIRSHLKTLLGIEYPKKKRGRPKRV